MKCRAIPSKALQQGERSQWQGRSLFADYVLKELDFIELDHLNKKIITRHSEEKMLRIWCISSYELCFELTTDDSYLDITVCKDVIGIMQMK